MRKLGLCMMVLLVMFTFAIVPQAKSIEKADLKIFTEEYSPLNFKKNGKITGLATDVVRELQKRIGSDDDIELVAWEEGYKAVFVKPNTVLFSIAMTQERKDKMQWVGPIGVLDTNLYALKGTGIKVTNLYEAKKVNKIATVTDYYNEQELKKEGFTNLESCPNEETALRKMLEGKAQLFASNNLVMPTDLEKIGAKIDDVENVFTISTDLFYIAFSPKTSPELVARWQAALDKMKRDGTFNQIYAKWLPAEMPPGIYQLMTEEYPPISYVKDGKPAGIVTDMVRKIAARLDVPDNIRLTSWKNAYNMALLHPNVVLFSAERTPQRENLFHWVGPVGKNRSILYAKKGSNINVKSLEDAKNIGAIATTTNWFTEQTLKNEGFTNLVSSPEPVDNVRQLMKGEVQLSIFTDITIPEIVKNAGYSMDDLEPVLTVSQTYFYIAVSKDTSAEVVKAWQSTLDSLKKDGTFKKIYLNYLPDADLDGLVSADSH